MTLSAEQDFASSAGLRRAPTWTEIARPIGRQPVPEWARGVHINWMEPYSNSPDVVLKASGSLRDWPDKRFVREGNGLYRAYAPDGRLDQWSHSGRLAPTRIRVFARPDGSTSQQRRQDATGQPEPGEWVDTEVLATTQQDGLAGSHIHITLIDGTRVILRGPWDVSPPAGYVGLAYVDADLPRDRRIRWHRGIARPLMLREDVFINVLSRFAPHIRLAHVNQYGRSRIEPIKPQWDAPKCAIIQ